MFFLINISLSLIKLIFFACVYKGDGTFQKGGGGQSNSQ